MRRRIPLHAGCLLVALHLLACGATSSGSKSPDTGGPDTAANRDVATEDAAGADLAVEMRREPAFQSWFSPFIAPPEEGAVLWLTRDPVNGPDLVTFTVHGRSLGEVGGLAFYLRFDAELLEFVNGQTQADFAGASPYFTRDLIRELEPGLVTYGVARFCKSKMPWGSTDQCGGVVLDADTPIVSLTFRLKGPGQGALSMPAAHRLIRRPDRSLVEATWIGGSVQVLPEGGE